MTRDLILTAVDRATGEVMEAGKPSGLQIVPKKITGAMVRAFHGASIDPTHQERYDAMLSASSVDLSGVEVKLPEPFSNTDDHDEYSDGHNACLDAITAQMKGE